MKVIFGVHSGVFRCLSYPNADRLRRAMPKGHCSLALRLHPSWEWALSQDGFGKKPLIPADPSAKSEICSTGLDQSLHNDPSLKPLQWNHFHYGGLFFTSQLGFLCVRVHDHLRELSKHQAPKFNLEDSVSLATLQHYVTFASF